MLSMLWLMLHLFTLLGSWHNFLVSLSISGSTHDQRTLASPKMNHNLSSGQNTTLIISQTKRICMPKPSQFITTYIHWLEPGRHRSSSGLLPKSPGWSSAHSLVRTYYPEWILWILTVSSLAKNLDCAYYLRLNCRLLQKIRLYLLRFAFLFDLFHRVCRKYCGWDEKLVGEC